MAEMLGMISKNRGYKQQQQPLNSIFETFGLSEEGAQKTIFMLGFFRK